MDESDIKTSEDRREYFRLSDSVVLDYRVIREGEVEAVRGGIDAVAANRFSVSASFASISRQMEIELRKITRSAPTTAELLKQIDNKLNTLAGLLALDDFGAQRHTTQAINMSAGGIAFFDSEPHKSGELLDVKLLLQPSHIGIRFIGRVVGCRSKSHDADGKPHYISVEILHIRGAERDLIVRHLLQKQGQVLHEQRFGGDLE